MATLKDAALTVLSGRSYSELGSSSSDLILKTKGKVKIKYGNKYIDLIKDGKVANDNKVIYKADEIGSKDGIWVVGDSVTLVSSEKLFSLSGSNSPYVSSLAVQNFTYDLKKIALRNIGLVYESVESMQADKVDNGLVYIESQTKLCKIKDSKIESEFEILPIGAIIMFNGVDIPENWAVCDGTKGTPNLIDSFIIGGDDSDTTEKGINLVDTVVDTYKVYKLIYIMKIK